MRPLGLWLLRVAARAHRAEAAATTLPHHLHRSVQSRQPHRSPLPAREGPTHEVLLTRLQTMSCELCTRSERRLRRTSSAWAVAAAEKRVRRRQAQAATLRCHAAPRAAQHAAQHAGRRAQSRQRPAEVQAAAATTVAAVGQASTAPSRRPTTPRASGAGAVTMGPVVTPQLALGRRVHRTRWRGLSAPLPPLACAHSTRRASASPRPPAQCGASLARGPARACASKWEGWRLAAATAGPRAVAGGRRTRRTRRYRRAFTSRALSTTTPWWRWRGRAAERRLRASAGSRCGARAPSQGGRPARRENVRRVATSRAPAKARAPCSRSSVVQRRHMHTHAHRQQQARRAARLRSAPRRRRPGPQRTIAHTSRPSCDFDMRQPHETIRIPVKGSSRSGPTPHTSPPSALFIIRLLRQVVTFGASCGVNVNRRTLCPGETPPPRQRIHLASRSCAYECMQKFRRPPLALRETAFLFPERCSLSQQSRDEPA